MNFAQSFILELTLQEFIIWIGKPDDPDKRLDGCFAALQAYTDTVHPGTRPENSFGNNQSLKEMIGMCLVLLTSQVQHAPSELPENAVKH